MQKGELLDDELVLGMVNERICGSFDAQQVPSHPDSLSTLVRASCRGARWYRNAEDVLQMAEAETMFCAQNGS